jgi:hypothetical protein
VIIQGEVVEKTRCYREPETGEIFTYNKVKVLNTYKGKEFGYVYVSTIGGAIDDISMYATHTLQLSVGEIGIFILDAISKNDTTYKYNNFADKIFKIPYDDRYQGYNNNTNKSIPNWNIFVQDFAKQFPNKLKVNLDAKKLQDAALCYRFANNKIDIEKKEIQFDIEVKSSIPTLKFTEADLTIKYPTDIFGENIFNNNKIAIEKSVFVQSNSFDLKLQDIDKEDLQLSIDNNCNTANESFEFGVDYEKLVTVTLKYDDILGFQNFTKNSFDFKGRAQYSVLNGVCNEFHNICYENDITTGAACAITKISFVNNKGLTTNNGSSGTYNRMIVEGSGFGASSAFKKISIPNADDGNTTQILLTSSINNEYIPTWTDAKIEVNLSSMVNKDQTKIMGSGIWKFFPDITNSSLTCEKVIDIEYALDNRNFIPQTGASDPEEKMISLVQNPFISVNQIGNIEYYIDRKFDNNTNYTNAINIIQRVFCEWESSAGLNFTYMGLIDNPTSGDNKHSVISGGINTSSNLGMATSHLYRASCYGQDASGKVIKLDDIFFGRDVEFDINIFDGTIRNGIINWFVNIDNKGIKSNQIDLYSSLLHEVGHALQLDHSMDIIDDNTKIDDRLMYFDQPKGTIFRTVDAKTLKGNQLLKKESLSGLNRSCTNGYKLNTNIDNCLRISTNTKNISEKNCTSQIIGDGNKIIIKPNESKINNLSIFNSLGVNIYNSAIILDKDTVINIESSSNQIYFVSYLCDNSLVTSKIFVNE